MNDYMNPLVQFSPVAGKLTLITVPGESKYKEEYENDVAVVKGADRSMYAYAPVSGCPDAKQAQILYVLRNDASEESAVALMERLNLKGLAESEHVLILMPNPACCGWNFKEKKNKDDDMEFLIRSFAILKGSELKMNGFNGMLFFVGTDEASSAMIMTMAAKKPANVSAMLTGELPSCYQIPADALQVECAGWCHGNAVADYLLKNKGPSCQVIVDDRPLNADVMKEAWDQLFSRTRRWQNDTFGTYQPRTEFTKRGFVAHYQDSSLGVNDGFPHTWYEYIPPQLRGTTEKVPLVFYFHGVNCVPLYGAEQSNWHDIADQENFIVVYPAPAQYKAWNIFNLPSLVNDFAFVMALIEHMKTVHPIDETRIYSTGFSMGGMMTHALTSAYPNVFAGAGPCNAFAMARFQEVYPSLKMFIPKSEEELGSEKVSANMGDAMKAEHPEYRMPVFQNAGLNDGLIASWPAASDNDDVRMKTLRYWKAYNNIPMDEEFAPGTVTGLKADETFTEDAEGRFTHQRWYSADADHAPLLELVTADRMPHAIDLIQPKLAWKYLKQFSRMADGTLKYNPEA